MERDKETERGRDEDTGTRKVERVIEDGRDREKERERVCRVISLSLPLSPELMKL